MMKKLKTPGKTLSREEMKNIIGGLLPPANGICYQIGENCPPTSMQPCCPNMNLVCVPDAPGASGHCQEPIID